MYMLELIWELITGAQKIVFVLFLHKEVKKISKYSMNGLKS